MARRILLANSILALIFASLPTLAAAQERALLLFDGETGRTFAGCLNCNRYDSASVCNRYGDYGSIYSDKSIWSRYGNFGSRYAANSPWSRYGEGLRIVDEEGNFYGMFTLSRSGRSRFPIVQALLDAFDEGVDLHKIRDLYCEN